MRSGTVSKAPRVSIMVAEFFQLIVTAFPSVKKF